MKTIKSVLFSVFLFTILFSCALKPTEIEKEKKDYQGTIHNVENANYEFEERLNSFYESEHIANKDLDKLYKGEYPDGVEEPTMLRIHWQKARELAIAELDMQKGALSESKKWVNATLSQRPILVLDKDGGDYYRYYEYRILEDYKEVGAIRIPVYKRTENFATSEVHLYSGDGKTYKTVASLWGLIIAMNMVEDKNTEFFKEISKQADVIVTDNFVYNYLHFIYEDLGLDEKVTPFTTREAYDKLYDFYDKSKGVLDGTTKKPISDNDKKLIIDASARKNTYEYRDLLTTTKKMLFKLESIATLVDDSAKKDIGYAIENIRSTDFFTGINLISLKMIDNVSDTLITKMIKEIYWERLENNISKPMNEYLLKSAWNIYKELDKKEIKPIIEYPEYVKYPQKEKKLNPKYKFEEYRLLSSIDEHSKMITSVLGFVSKNGFKSSLWEHMDNANGHEFSKEAVDSGNEEEKSSKYSLFSYSSTLSEGDKVDTKKQKLDALVESGKLYSRMRKSKPWKGLTKLPRLIDPFKDATNPTATEATLLIAGNIAGTIVFLANPIAGVAVFSLTWGNLVTEGLIKLCFGPMMIRQQKIIEMAGELEALMREIHANEGEKGLKEFKKYLIDLKDKEPFKSDDYYKKLLNHAMNKTDDYIINGPSSLLDSLYKAYDWWLVYYYKWIPWFWQVNKRGGVVTRIDENKAKKGFPLPWTFNIDNLFDSSANPPEIQEPEKSLEPQNYMEEATTPEKLKSYMKEWTPVNKWLDANKFYSFDSDGKPTHFANITTDNLENIIESAIDRVYDLYSGTSSVYIEKDKPYSIATNVITNKVVTGTDKITQKPIYGYEYITNTKENIIINPSKEDKDLQNKFNINNLKDTVNNQYGISLSVY